MATSLFHTGGVPLQINTTLPGDQTGSDILLLANGGFIIAWTSLTGSSLTNEARGRLYGVDGIAIGDDFVLSDPQSFGAKNVSLALRADGSFVAAYTQFADNDFVGRLFEEDGTAIDDAFLLHESPDWNQNDGVITQAGDGFFAAWSYEERNFSDTYIKGRLFDDDGDPTTATDQTLSTVEATVPRNDPKIAALKGGGFALAYRIDENSSTNALDVAFTILNEDGAILVAEQRVANSSVNKFTDFSIAALEDGNFVVAWTSDANAPAFEVHARIYDPVGKAVTGDLFVSRQTGGNGYLSEVIGLPDGGWVAAWGSTVDFAVHVRVFNEDGQPRAPEVIVPGSDAGAFLPEDIALEWHPWQGLIVTWTKATGSGFHTEELFGEVFTPPGLCSQVLVGSGGNDTLDGRDCDDELYGMNGNDRLLGGADNDRVEGGNGNDTIFGEHGNDILKGDRGKDTMEGGIGNDRMSGGDHDDAMSGGAGRDRMQGDAGNDRMDGDGGRDVMSGGSGNDILRGGDDDDRLGGAAGRDRLWGDGGDDLIFGGGSRDVLSGGNGDDTLDGGKGNDLLTGGLGGDIFVFGKGSGNDRITDLGTGRDSIQLDDALWGGGLTCKQVIKTFGSMDGTDLVLDFGTDGLRIESVAAPLDVIGFLDVV